MTQESEICGLLSKPRSVTQLQTFSTANLKMSFKTDANLAAESPTAVDAVGWFLFREDGPDYLVRSGI